MPEATITNPFEGRSVATSYPYPLKTLALKIRRIIQNEIKWTLESFVEEQRRLDAHVAAALRSLSESLQKQQEFTAKLASDLQEQKAALGTLANDMQDQKAALEKLSPRYVAGRYVAFQEIARGSPSLVRSRQASYVEDFRGRKNVLDAGCGRGEFLQLLKENGVEAYGVDEHAEMVEVARSYGLNVIQRDVIDHLRALEDRTLGGIFCSQVLEHLNSSDVLDFLNLAYAKMMPGSRIVLETVNPTSVLALTEFYRDPTHVKPIHPLTLKFLLESVGFTSVEIRYANVPLQNRLEPVEGQGEHVAVMNRNLTRLNDLLWGPFDYAVVGVR
jgi:O-antigen chain-terminating methyltransferase